MYVSKLFTGVEFFSTLQSNVRLRRLIVPLFDKLLYSAKISTWIPGLEFSRHELFLGPS